MNSPQHPGSTAGIPSQVFEAFLEAVIAANGNAEMVARLKKTLLETRDFSEVALESAIFGEEASDDQN